MKINIDFFKKENYKNVFALFSFLIPLTVYLITMTPVVYWFDSGEYVTTAWTYGISHPGGYPTYNTIGFLFSHTFGVFTDNIAWVMNFMAVLSCSLAILFMFYILNYILKNAFYALVSSLITAFVVNFWLQALWAEVYSLNVFFLALAVLLILRWDATRKSRFLYYFAFVFALGCGNHSTIITTAPAFIIFILITQWQMLLKFKGGWLTFMLMGVIFFATLIAIFSQFVISSAIGTGFHWVKVDDWHSFLWLASAENYNATGCKVDFIKYWQFIIDGLHIIYRQFGEVGKIFTLGKSQMNVARDVPLHIGTIIVALGIVSMLMNLFDKYTRYIILFLLILFGYILFYGSYQPFPDFIVPTYFCFGVFIAFGFRDICEMVKDSLKNSSKELRRIVLSIVYVLISVIPIIYLVDNVSYLIDDRKEREKCDKSDYRSADDYARSMLDNVPQDSLILFGGDSETPIMYYQFVKNYRPDVEVVHVYLYALERYGIVDANKVIIPDLKKRFEEYNTMQIENVWVSLVKKELIEPNYDKRPIYVVNFDPSTDYSFTGQWIKHGIKKDANGKDIWAHEIKEWDNTDLLSDYDLVHHGNLSRVVKKEDFNDLYLPSKPEPVFKVDVSVNKEFRIIGFDIKGYNEKTDVIEVPKGKHIPITFYYEIQQEIKYFNTEKFIKLNKKNRNLCKKVWALYKIKKDTSNEYDKELAEDPPLVIQEQRPLWYGIPGETIPSNTYLKEKLFFYIKSDRVDVGDELTFNVGFMDTTGADPEADIGDVLDEKTNVVKRPGLQFKDDRYFVRYPQEGNEKLPTSSTASEWDTVAPHGWDLLFKFKIAPYEW